MKIPVYQVDAFTDNPFQGNPAAVVILDQPQTIRWMQLVAREMNLSETAFVCREARGYHLQWFTPEAEVELCGHATLSAAHVLWESGRESLENPIFFPPSRDYWVPGAGRTASLSLIFLLRGVYLEIYQKK